MVASMPVAKLSREFYDRFGDKVTNELVNCLNSIEGSYRAEIKDLFAAHLIKWTFVFWAPVALAVIGLYFKT